MNVYDFDKTIYDGDSTTDFIAWCIRRRPSLAAVDPFIQFYRALPPLADIC